MTPPGRCILTTPEQPLGGVLPLHRHRHPPMQTIPVLLALALTLPPPLSTCCACSPRLSLVPAAGPVYTVLVPARAALPGLMCPDLDRAPAHWVSATRGGACNTGMEGARLMVMGRVRLKGMGGVPLTGMSCVMLADVK